MKRDPPIPAQVLPADATALLIRASQIENTADDPKARDRAVEAATRRIKKAYPQYFVQE